MTVTPATSTVTSTVTIRPTVYTTSVETALSTTSETQTLSTVTSSVTTEQTQTASTETDFVTVTVTADPAKVKKARSAITQTSSTYPAYASPCSAWDKYVSACSCVGVFPTVITVATPVTTTVVTETTVSPFSVLLSVEECRVQSTNVNPTQTVTSSILSTTSSTETDIATATDTTVIITDTLTIAVTSTTLATVTSTAIPTASPSPVCSTGSVRAFRAHATQYGDSDLYMYANTPDYVNGAVIWNANTAATAPTLKNRYIWAIDSAGYLYMAYQTPPYNYIDYAYVNTATSGSVWPQVARQTVVENSIANGASVSKIKACVDSVTGELHLNAAGRTQILWCGAQMWMSNTLGSDINRGECTQMFPTIVPEPVV